MSTRKATLRGVVLPRCLLTLLLTLAVTAVGCAPHTHQHGPHAATAPAAHTHAAHAPASAHASAAAAAAAPVIMALDCGAERGHHDHRCAPTTQVAAAPSTPIWSSDAPPLGLMGLAPATARTGPVRSDRRTVIPAGNRRLLLCTWLV